MDEGNAVRTGQSCTDAEAGQQVVTTTGRSSPAILTVDVVSDVLCPWCYIGKRRLEKALSLLQNPAEVRVFWKPFQLNPQMPPQGVERRTYRIAKFGSWEESQARDAQVAAAGAGEGITFAFDKMSRTPNTLDAHRVIWIAQRIGIQDAAVEMLFRAYFEEGLNLNDQSTLVSLAARSGIGDAERMLDGNEGQAEVLGEEAHYKSLGVSGVPAFFFNGRFAFSGAVAASLMADAIRQELQRSKLANIGPS